MTPGSRITLRPRLLEFYAQPQETLLAAAQRQGITIRQACRSGVCYLCQATLRHGSVRDRVSQLRVSATPASPALIYCCNVTAITDCEVEVDHVLAPGELPQQTVAATITAIQQPNADIRIVQLRLPAGKRIEYYPGQYLEILLPDDQSAAFSIASIPNDERLLELHIGAAPESATYQQIEPRLVVGQTLKLRLPCGNTRLDRLDNVEKLILIGASTGYAQAKSMLLGLIARADPRPVHLYWGARKADELYDHANIEALAAAHPNMHYIPVVSDDAAWQGRAGLVHQAVLKDFPDMSQVGVMCSGSPVMVYRVLDDFIEAGLPETQMISDVFDYAPR